MKESIKSKIEKFVLEEMDKIQLNDESEYDNLYNYLYKPYKSLGGNGSAERIMEEVKKLPIK